MTERQSDTGAHDGVGALLAEIAELKESRDKLLESLERYQIHFSLTRDIIYTIDPEFRITSVSPSVTSVLGFTPKDLVGKRFTEFDIMAPESFDTALENALKVLSGESRRGDIFAYLDRNGNRMYGEVSGVPLYRNGRVESIVSVARDITGRLDMERSLRESEARFRAVFESAEDCIFTKDRTLRYTSVNPSMTRLLGLAEGEVLGRYDADIFGLATGLYLRGIDLKVVSGEISKEENDLPVCGQTLTFHVIKVPMRDVAGNITGLCGIARNITERKRFEQELRSKEEQLKLQASNLKDANTALKVLLDHRGQEKIKMKEDLVTRTKALLYPYLDKLRDAVLGGQTGVYLDIIRTNLDDLVSEYADGVSSGYRQLTPTEITVADLVKQGKTTKEIACLMNVSQNAVSFHRTNIRRKLKLSNRRANLRSHLLHPEADR